MVDRVLILAPRGRDAPVIGQVLSQAGTEHRVCADVEDLRAAIEEGAGAALVTEEALSSVDVAPLMGTLERQPPWSDFPFIVLATKRSGPRPVPASDRLEG